MQGVIRAEQNAAFHSSRARLSISREGKVSHVVASPGDLVYKKQRAKSMASSQGAGKPFPFPGHTFEINP